MIQGGCALAQQRSLAVEHRSSLAFNVAYGASEARLTLDVAQLGEILVVEQPPDGGFYELVPDSQKAPDSLSPGKYVFSVTRYFPLAPTPLPPPPDAPCWEDGPSDTGMQRIWPGFCRLSPSMEAATRRLGTAPNSFEPLPDTHRVFAVQVGRPISSEAVATALESLPFNPTPQALVEQLGTRLAVTDVPLRWVAVALPSRDR